eukprot:gene33592-43414_t
MLHVQLVYLSQSLEQVCQNKRLLQHGVGPFCGYSVITRYVLLDSRSSTLSGNQDYLNIYKDDAHSTYFVIWLSINTKYIRDAYHEARRKAQYHYTERAKFFEAAEEASRRGNGLEAK